MSKHAVLKLAANLNLESERKAASQSHKAARVKIERGHAWLIRLLPFPQGPSEKPFAQLAQHWIGGRSVMCKSLTSSEFGGDPTYDCPICSTVDACKNEARDDDERDEFYQVEARVQFRCYCIVIKREDDRGRTEESNGDELLVPHEFFIPKSSFNALCSKIDRSTTRKDASPLGLLDLETGCDLWAIRDKKNSLTFDLSDEGPMPIFTLDEAFDEKLNRVWKQMKQPTVKFLPDDRMGQLADMVAEKAFEKAAKSLAEDSGNGEGRGSRFNRNGGDDRRGGGARGRFHEADDQGDREEAPRRQASARPTASAARGNSFSRAQAALGDGPGGDDDQIPGAEVPPRRTAAPAARRTAEPVEEAPTAGDPQDGAPVEEAPPVSARRGGATARPAAAPGRVSVPAAVAAGRRAGNPPPAPAPRAGEGGRIEDEGPGEGDPAPEQADPAPAEPAETAPVTQQAKAAPARSSLQGALRSSVANLASRGR